MNIRRPGKNNDEETSDSVQDEIQTYRDDSNL